MQSTQYHQCERIYLLLVSEASKGLDDVVAGRSKDACTILQAIKRRRVAEPTVFCNPVKEGKA
jgi:hypothetical protein